MVPGNRRRAWCQALGGL